MTTRGERQWLGGFLADQIERQIAGVADGKAGVYLRPEQWRAAVARLRDLRSDGVSEDPTK